MTVIHLLVYTLTPQFSEIGPFKLTENCENENYELCSNWAGKNRKLRGLLGCLDRKLRGMSMIWNTENCENENYGGENCGVTVYIKIGRFLTILQRFSLFLEQHQKSRFFFARIATNRQKSFDLYIVDGFEIAIICSL